MFTNEKRCFTLLFVVILSMIRPDVDAAPCDVTTSVDGDSVQCCYRRLTKVPEKLPADVVQLNISFNFLTSLTSLMHPNLRYIRHLKVSHNQLTSLPSDVFGDVPHLQVLDLGHNPLQSLSDGAFRGLTDLTVLVLAGTGLHTLPDLLFTPLPHLTSLDLSSNVFSSVPTKALQHVSSLRQLTLNDNRLQTLANFSLLSLHHLQQLSVSGNHLSGLQPASFAGLHTLTSLDLSHNHLALDNRSYPPGVFSSLGALQSLRLNGNDLGEEGEYPLNVLDPLQSLTELSIDTFSESHFGAAFASLTQLTSLTLASSGCRLKRISNQTFSAFRHSGLKTLYISGCPLMEVDVCAFCHLPNLTSLTVSGIKHVKISVLLLALFGLQNQTLKLVDFSYIRQYPATELDEVNTAYLQNVCIRKFSLRFSRILGSTSRVVQIHRPFWNCLKDLDLSENELSMVDRNIFLKFGTAMTSLETLQIQNQKSFSQMRRSWTSAHSNPIRSRTFLDTWTLYANTPASLRSFNASAAMQDLDQLPGHIHFPHGGNLTVLDLSYCSAFDFQTSITGLTSLQTLDFSGNDCSLLSVSFFQNLTTLRRLRFAQANLQDQFLLDNGTELLRPLRNLEELGLGGNDLHGLPHDLLHNQPDLVYLDLSDNRFQTVPVDLTLLPALREVDLTNNMIPYLPLSLTHTLDHLAATHTFTLRLRGNPLTCTCQTLDMVAWLATTDVRLDGDITSDGFDDDYDDNGRDYPCVLEDGRLSSTVSVMAQWEAHWRHCVGLGLLTVSAVALLVQLLGLVVTYLLWTNWTYVRHAWRVLRRLRLPRRHDFEQDAVLVHAEADLEVAVRVKRWVGVAGPAADHLRLALPIEVIPAGSVYLEELAELMENSWKIMVLVTPQYLQDHWAGFTTQQAQRGITDTTPGRVILLYLGLQHHQQPQQQDVGPCWVSLRRLMGMVPESHVYHVPTAVAAGADCPRHPVWSAVAQRVARDPE